MNNYLRRVVPVDQAVGRPVGAIQYPPLRYQKQVRQDGSGSLIEYSIDALWRCRWVFDVEMRYDPARQRKQAC